MESREYTLAPLKWASVVAAVAAGAVAVVLLMSLWQTQGPTSRMVWKLVCALALAALVGWLGALRWAARGGPVTFRWYVLVGPIVLQAEAGIAGYCGTVSRWRYFWLVLALVGVCNVMRWIYRFVTRTRTKPSFP